MEMQENIEKKRLQELEEEERINKGEITREKLDREKARKLA